MALLIRAAHNNLPTSESPYYALASWSEVVDCDTFIPVTTESLKYGKRVIMLVLPCDPVWRTQAGIDLAGPRWFGYDLDYIPYEQIRSVLA